MRHLYNKLGDNDPITWGQLRKIVNCFSVGFLIFAVPGALIWGAQKFDMISFLSFSRMLVILLAIAAVITFIQLIRILKNL